MTSLVNAYPAEIAIWSIIGLSLIVVIVLLFRANRGPRIEDRGDRR